MLATAECLQPPVAGVGVAVAFAADRRFDQARRRQWRSETREGPARVRSTVVMHVVRIRKHYERQGPLVEPRALADVQRGIEGQMRG